MSLRNTPKALFFSIKNKLIKYWKTDAFPKYCLKFTLKTKDAK